ncbi:3-coathanger stack domain-containing protein [Emticicia sp. SJ17W-69]|uniref:Ig-like domain-containing protein n=1 Tax=Emticicia sp. SJ17W-69 TaxID=3421657 RepID=UPI003EBBF003
MRKQLLIILLLAFIQHSMKAQKAVDCGIQRKVNIENQSKFKINSVNSIPDSNLIIRIPVVFHVYHHGEAQGYGYNYHEDTLKKALFNLNLAYSAKGGFKESVNTKIEFYLLTDSISCQPFGISNGIKRASMYDLPPYLAQSYFQQGLSTGIYQYFEKDILQLSPNPTIKCLNIRLIPVITDKQGFVSIGDLEDVVLRSNTITDKEGSSVFAHEIGHACGLLHTFFSNDIINCNDGDGLSDTDPHQINDIFYPDDINVCTGRRKGKVIYNFMSYGSYQNNFTIMQRDKMRETINFHYPEFVQGLLPVFSSPATKGIPINACTFSGAQPSTDFVYSVDFNLGSISYKNYYEKSLNYIDYSCALKTELTAGNNYNFYFNDYNTGTIYYKLLIDFNNDGDFNDNGEEILSGQKTTTITIQPISGNFIVPLNSIQNSWLRMRLIRTNDGSYTNCNTNGLGNAMDFSIKVLPNCIKPTSPTVSNQIINFGQSATLTSTNCFGQTKWYSKGESLSTGGNYTTPTLNKDTYYQATCVVNGCESLAKNIKIEVIQTLSIGALSSNNLCVNNTINIPITTTLTNNTILINFRKGNNIISSKVIQKTNSLSFKIPFQFTNYIGGPYEFLTYGNDYNIQLETIDIYTNKKLLSNVVSLNIGAIENGHRIIDNPNEIYDINKYSYSDYLCTGKSKTYYAQVVSFGGKSLTTDGLTFNWKRNGTSIGTTTTNQITVNQAGTYTFDVNQAGCIGSSSSLYLSTNSYINNSPKIIGPEYSCEGTNKELFSDYISTTATYQWQKDGTNISNANQSNFIATQSGNYNVIVQDAGCTINKNKDVNIVFLKALPVSIFSNNNDTTICITNVIFGLKYGNDIRLEDSFGNGLAILNDYQYQWQKNGVDIPNETKNYLDFGYHDYLNNGLGTYRLLKKQASCTSYSKPITISESTIRPKPIIDYKSTLAVCSGSVGLYAGFLTPGDWYKDNSKVSSGSFYTAYNSGVYKYVVDANETCQNESDPINISIGSNFSPKITYSDIRKQNLCGTNDYLFLNFDFANSYTGFTYQWLKNGIEITNGTGSQLYINTSGTYSLRVTNGSCTATSNAIIVGNNNNDIKLKSLDFDLACTNRSAKIEISGISNNNNLDNFIWKLNGNILTNEKLGWLYTDKAGTYSVEYNNNAGCSISSNSVIINKGGGSITIQPITAAQGQSALLSAIGCSNGLIKWYNSNSLNTVILTGNTLITPALDISRSYFATCFYNGCENLVPTEGQIIVSGCLQNQTFGHINQTNGTFRATNKISSSALISNGTIYSGGKSVELLPGFQVTNNRVFKAEIGGCN